MFSAAHPAGAAPLDGDMRFGPPPAELRIGDRKVADELGEARVVRLACARGCTCCQRERSTYRRWSIRRFACLTASWLSV
jgi:hypothetical protein